MQLAHTAHVVPVNVRVVVSPPLPVLRPCTSAVSRVQRHTLLTRAGSCNSWVVRAAAGTGSGSGSGSSGGGSGGSGGAGGSSSGDGSSAHPLRLWTFLYAALLAAGGIIAFVKKGSSKSLSSAAGAALILALSARTMVGAQAKGSIAVCLAIALLLSVLMAGRYSRTRKLMPAGVTAAVSLTMSAAYLGSLFQ